MGTLKAAVDQTGRLWSGLMPAQRLVVAVLSLSLVGFAGGLVYWASRPDYAPLFTNLSTSDAGEIVGKLRDSNTPYRVSDGGSVVRVPSNKVYDLRLRLAGEGLPKGSGVGFEVFDKAGVGMTEFTQRLNYQRALQGELARTIEQVDAVELASVHIVIPQAELYTERQQEPTASVLLKLVGGKTLTSGQVEGVVHLVSSAVEGLKPDSITVIDSHGEVLSDGVTSRGAGEGLSFRQAEAQRGFEDQLARSIQSMLERVMGPSRSIVRVKAEMNFDRGQVKSETYQPLPTGEGVLRTQRDMEETYNGSATPPRGPAGVTGAVAFAAAGAAGQTSKYTRRDTSTEYSINKRVEDLVKAPGEIKRLSVSVLLDGAPKGTTVAALQQAVSAAAGINPTRGDTLSVETMEFDRTYINEAKKDFAKAQREKLIYTIARGTGLALLVVFLFVAGLRSLNAVRRMELITVEQAALPGAPKRALEPGPERIEFEEEVEPSVEELRKPKSRPQAYVEALSDQHPDDVAQLLRSWLVE